MAARANQHHLHAPLQLCQRMSKIASTTSLTQKLELTLPSCMVHDEPRKSVLSSSIPVVCCETYNVPTYNI